MPGQIRPLRHGGAQESAGGVREGDGHWPLWFYRASRVSNVDRMFITSAAYWSGRYVAVDRRVEKHLCCSQSAANRDRSELWTTDSCRNWAVASPARFRPKSPSCCGTDQPRSTTEDFI